MKVIKLHRNSDPKNQPQASCSLIINYNINYEFGSNTVEDGFDNIVEYKAYWSDSSTYSNQDKTVIGHILLPDNSICLMSIFGPASTTEIGILKDSIYKPVLRALLSMNDKYPIEGTSKLNNKNETLIYFTDFKNAQRWLNLTNPQVITNDALFTTEISKLLYFPAFESQFINLLSINEGGGNLPTGAYIPVYKYVDESYNETNLVYNTSVISLGDGTVPGVKYDGAEPNSNSNKSITLQIQNTDDRYRFIHLYLVYKASTAYVVYDCGYKVIDTTNTCTVVVSTLDTLTTVPLETVTVQRPYYKTAKTVTQLDAVMYWGNLKERESFDFQPYVNNIVVTPIYEQSNIVSNTNQNYRDELIIFNKKSFMFDNTYALYASFQIEDEFGSYETKAYHIPGRKKLTVTYGGTYSSPSITGGVVLNTKDISNISQIIAIDEDDLLDSYHARYIFSHNGGFPTVGAMGSLSSAGTLNPATNRITYTKNTNIPNLINGTLYLIGTISTNSYFYVRIVSSTVTGSSPSYLHTHVIEIIRKNVNATLVSDTFTTYRNLQPIVDNSTTNGLTTSDTSPAGEMYQVNNQARVFHAFPTGGAMGYWENENEYYSNYDNWLVKDASGNTTSNIKNQHVRHHRFPHASAACSELRAGFHKNVNGISGFTSSQYEEVYILGIRLSSITIPNEYVGKIKKVNLYYAKQRSQDKVIIGQSLALHDGYLYTDDNFPGSENFVTHVGGNIEIINQKTSIDTSGSYVSVSILKNKKFIKASPFDIVSNDSLQTVSHINILYKLTTYYKCLSASDPNSNISSNGKVTSICHEWRLDDKTTPPVYIENGNLAIFNRKVIKHNYIDSVPDYPYGLFDPVANANRPEVQVNASVYGTSKSIYHYRADKVVLMELQNELSGQYSASYTQYAQLPPHDDIENELSTVGIQKDAEIYLVNLCSFKSDIYQGFDGLELAQAGSFDYSLSSPTIFGGDTFSNYYAYRSCCDLSGIWNYGMAYDRKWQAFELRMLHYFICQSVSNINYRNRGTSEYDSYFPFNSDANSFLANTPLIPNGQPNYYSYNKAYNTVNEIHQPAIGEMLPITSVFSFPTRVLRTAKDNVESIYDNYRVVLANDYLDLSKDKGSIWALRALYNKLNIIFENTIKETLGRERILTQNAESYVGAGDIFAVVPKDLITVDGGFGGTMSQWAINITPFGMFYVDINRGKVFLKAGELKEISKDDMFYFFRDQLPLKFYSLVVDRLNKVIPLWVPGIYNSGNIVRHNKGYYQAKVTTSNLPTDLANWNFLYDEQSLPLVGLDSVHIGLKSGYDPIYKRIILSKQDLEFSQTFPITDFLGIYTDLGGATLTNNKIYFVDGEFKKYSTLTSSFTALSYGNRDYFNPINWTISYYPEYESWGSFYTFYPEMLFNSNDALYSSYRYSIYEHNKHVLPIFYGGLPEIATLEMIFNPDPDSVKQFKSVQFKTKVAEYNADFTEKSQEYLQTFDSYQAYNSYQLSKESALTNLTTARNLEGFWSINNFRDYFDNGGNIFQSIKSWDLPFSAVNVSKHWSKLKRFVDNWFTVRFKYDNFKTSVFLNFDIVESSIKQVENVASDYYLIMDFDSAITFEVGDWVLLNVDNAGFGGADYVSMAQVLKVNGITYTLKAINPVYIGDNTTTCSIISIKQIYNYKLTLLETTSTYIKNTR
jgi:hypothetical protein